MEVSKLKSALSKLPLIAILRGLDPTRSIEVAEILYLAGFKVLEIPLNSPNPLRSIETIRQKLGEQLLIGAGTVLKASDVKSVYDAGGQLVISPNTDLKVIKHTKKLLMISIPGVFTPTEAFSALNLGADMLKLFPAEIITPSTLRAWRAVLPKDIWLLPVGGIKPESLWPFLSAGANGFGVGSFLFSPQYSNETIKIKAKEYVQAYQRVGES